MADSEDVAARTAAVAEKRPIVPAGAYVLVEGRLPVSEFAAVRAAGGRIVVVTAKKAELAELHLRHLELVPDEVRGLAWADGKAEALRATGAVLYVGDHVADMAAARAAGVCAVGVTTGPCGAGELVGAGADFVLADLRDLPPIVQRRTA